MLRNRGPNDNMTAAQGRALEDSFFSQAPWSEVKRFHKAGMHELRIKVLNLLLCHTDLSWYDIRNEVTRQLYNLESLRVSLGNSRSRRQHFFALAETFQKTANSHVSEFKEPQSQLKEYLGRLDNQFAEAISHESRIDYDKSQNALGAEEELYYTATSPRLYSELLGGNESFKNNRPASSSICQAGTILRTIFPIIDQLLDKQTSPRHVESLLDSAREYENVINARLNSGNVNPNRLKHIKTVRTDQQGADLETFNRSVIKIFQKESKDWETLALMYVQIYIIAVQGFIETVMIEVCPTTIRNKLQDYLAKEIETCY